MTVGNCSAICLEPASPVSRDVTPSLSQNTGPGISLFSLHLEALLGTGLGGDVFSNNTPLRHTESFSSSLHRRARVGEYQELMSVIILFVAAAGDFLPPLRLR